MQVQRTFLYLEIKKKNQVALVMVSVPISSHVGGNLSWLFDVVYWFNKMTEVIYFLSKSLMLWNLDSEKTSFRHTALHFQE